ncbi:hypothetical protein NP493_181g00013 [Ridgeia piscesae]|uniref:Metallo-beta-lactamase domain-containing protein n=1 Tax=Ridgeia piscesae TaxID=27915 RepID=A0AAD9UEX9_RIDPI|nr:hypothetical protein NP493_181g00013 [Ridgeia piscesae]
MNPTWFTTRKVADNIYLTCEESFNEGNRCNIWLIKGPGRDVVIDCGLGVCDLRRHLEGAALITPPGGDRECLVICTHAHFDHSGGAHHFPNVLIHEKDAGGLRNGRQTETLNYVKPGHFDEKPYAGFSACAYRVPPTSCEQLRDGDRLDIGGGEHLEIMHMPGHTKGSIAIYYAAKQALFTGDFVYDCWRGGALLDWLPTSSVRDYVRSANTMLHFLDGHPVASVFPGHFRKLTGRRTAMLLTEYIEEKDNEWSVCHGSCLQMSMWTFFLLGCFRCCPC